MSAWDSEFYQVVKELDETQRKLKKAAHDRDRYARRIRFLQGRHAVLAREFHAIQKERDLLNTCVTILERRLADEQGRTAQGEKAAQKIDRELSIQAARQFERDVKRDGIFDAKAALNDPHYMAKVTQQRIAERAGWDRNGITKEDLKTEYNRGYAAARKDLARFQMQFFYSAAAIASHRLFHFGETRILRLLDDIQLIMTEEITTCDIRDRCKRETGVDIIDNDYDS